MAVPARLFHAEGGDLRADFDPHGLQARGGPDAARAAKPALPDGRDALLSTLPGRKVHDAHGTELGQVAGAIVDLRSRRHAAQRVRNEGRLRTCPHGRYERLNEAKDGLLVILLNLELTEARIRGSCCYKIVTKQPRVNLSTIKQSEF